ARPLLAALRPELTCVLQPLGGEYAGTRELLTSVPFAPGYGVEIGLLVDTYDRLGLDAIAQVNLGVRTHRNRPLTELASMSRQGIATPLSRRGVPAPGASAAHIFARRVGGPHTVLPRGRPQHPAPPPALGGGPPADDLVAPARVALSVLPRERV